LSRNLKRAQLVSAPGADAAFELLATGKVEALAGLTQALLGLAPKLPGSRLVEGRFMGVQQSIAVPKGKDAGLLYLRAVVEEAKQSGLVARAIERTGAKGVSVAPPAKERTRRSVRRRSAPDRSVHTDPQGEMTWRSPAR